MNILRKESVSKTSSKSNQLRNINTVCWDNTSSFCRFSINISERGTPYLFMKSLFTIKFAKWRCSKALSDRSLCVYIISEARDPKEKKRDILLSPMTKALIPTYHSIKIDNTKTPPNSSNTQQLWLRMVSWSTNSHQILVVRFMADLLRKYRGSVVIMVWRGEPSPTMPQPNNKFIAPRTTFLYVFCMTKSFKNGVASR